jgi:hypothetical protein
MASISLERYKLYTCDKAALGHFDVPLHVTAGRVVIDVYEMSNGGPQPRFHVEAKAPSSCSIHLPQAGDGSWQLTLKGTAASNKIEIDDQHQLGSNIASLAECIRYPA